MVNTSQRTRLVVSVAIGAAFLASLDLFVVNVAFDAIAADLGVGQPGGPSAADLSWILSGYAVVFAALLVPFGRMADRYGRRQVFLAGLVVFLVASAACAVAWSVGALIAFRLVQAAGAAAMTPTSLAILLTALPPERRAGGVRLWAAIGAVAAAIGPTVGGVLAQFGWPWIFLINLPVGALIVVVAARVVPAAETGDDGPMPDLLGAGLIAAAVGLLALGLVKTPEWGWTAPATIACLVAAGVAGFAFWRRSNRHPAPVVDPALLRVPTFRWAVGSMVLFNVAFAVSLLAGVLWLQQVWGWSVMETGFAVAVGPVLVPITAAVVNRWFANVSAATLIAVGCALCAVGMSILAIMLGPVPAYASEFLPGWALVGVGVGFALPNLLAGATVDLAPDERATGSGVVTMARQIGFVIGVSVLFAIVGDRTGEALASAFTQAWWVAAAVLVAGAIAALRMKAAARLVKSPKICVVSPPAAIRSAEPLHLRRVGTGLRPRRDRTAAPARWRRVRQKPVILRHVPGDGLLTHDLLPNEKGPQDACGVFGVWAPGEEVAKLTYFGLYALQHRGQESAGIAVSDGTPHRRLQGHGPGLAGLQRGRAWSPSTATSPSATPATRPPARACGRTPSRPSAPRPPATSRSATTAT